MKKRTVIIGIIVIMCLFTACSSGKIQGVVTSESGEIQTVTFELPKGKSITDVLGCRVGSENKIHVTSMGNSGMKEYSVSWYKVDNGGIISKKGKIYRYAPNADVEYEQITNDFRPPNWVLLYDTPSDDNLFNPKDIDKLQEEYGIELFF